MSALPEPLARWSPLVADLPRDVADCLAPWMEQLARAIGPLRAHMIRGEGEPDGVDGVTRRAPFDRLLDTERLLATEVPDEFVRRAAQSELLFHALALKELRPARASLLLVDAGPAQLGAPRLAHLALVLVLAARAKDAGARFAWSLLQDPPVEGRPVRLVAGVEAPLPALLLLDRRALPPSPEDLAAWEDFAARAGWDDLWLVGADLRPSKRLRGGAVRVRDPVARGVARLDVEVECAGRTVHRALPLPPVATQVAVLRDPKSLFAKPAPPPVPARATVASDEPAGPPVFLCDGRKVVARGARGDILVFTVPTGGVARRSRPRCWYRPEGEEVLAVGWHRRRLVLLTRAEGALRRFDWSLDVFPMRRATLRPASPEVAAQVAALAADAPLGVMHFLAQSPTRRDDALLRTPDGAVLRVGADGELSTWTPHALALETLQNRVMVVCGEPEREAPVDPMVDRITLGANRFRARVGVAWALRDAGTFHGYRRVIASSDAAGTRWRVETPDGAAIETRPGEEVLGLIGTGTEALPHGLAVISADRRAVIAHGATRSFALAKVSEGIVGAALSPRGAELAFVTERRALRVYRYPGLQVLVARGVLAEET